MLKRERYLQTIRPFYHSDLVKIITGIRGAGKTVLLREIMEELAPQTDNMLYLDFEDQKTKNLVANVDSLIQYVETHRKKGTCYLFLDEVQLLDQWTEACKTLRLHDVSLFITGSNSKLLSGEFTKELSGRYVAFRVRPFVYQEIVAYTASLGNQTSVNDYLLWGGFPGRFSFACPEDRLHYLASLEDAIIQDLVSRHGIRKQELFKSFVTFILRNNARVFSANSLKEQVGERCSINTVINYLGYLKESYFVEGAKQYSAKRKRELHFYEKLYDADVAFNSLHRFDSRYDLERNLENIVYNELLWRGYSVTSWNNHGRAIDFLARKDGKQYYVQTAYSVVDEEVYDRAFSAFSGLDYRSQKIVITHDDLDYSTSLIRHIKMKDFLLMDTL